MPIWDQLISFQQQTVKKFDLALERYQEDHLDRFNYDGWSNITWRSEKFRRAHIDVVDARDTKKLWMMHICIFPHLNSGSPIYGFDVISGPNKVTGAFHDFSAVDPNHPALNFFHEVVDKTSWNKTRELPNWAKAIFSDNMVAAGNIQTEMEMKQLLDLVNKTTDWYLNDMQQTGYYEAANAQNNYAYFQKQNPHTPRTMKALGLDEQDVDFFVQKCLFPEV